MERPVWAPRGIDLTRPSVARMYDYYLGGSHNFEVDRAAARGMLDVWPDLPLIARANRAFMRRAVGLAADLGITQFLDIGSGIPTFGNVHEVAHTLNPGARVVYVDHDPVAVAHSEAMVAGDDRLAVLEADLRKPDTITDSPVVREMFDFGRPIALMLVALLHFIEDHDDPWDLVARLRDALPPGSCLILSHATDEGYADPPDEERDVYRRTGNPLLLRGKEQVLRFFDGFEVVEPGIVFSTAWRPEGALEDDPARFSGYVGFGLKR
jgi:SAM-dependent methyltransferase